MLLDKGLHSLYRLCGALAALFIVVIGCFVLVNVISRLLNIYVPGTAEGAGYSMAAAGALGLAYTVGEKGHIRVTLIISRFKGRVRKFLELFSLLVSTGFACYLAFYLVKMVYISYLFEDRSDGTDKILIWIPQVPMTFGFVVFAICLVHSVIAGIVNGSIDDGSSPSVQAH